MSTQRWLRQFISPPFGREPLIDQLIGRLRAPSRSVLTVTGEGGVGKTRVAVAAVEGIVAAGGVRVVAIDLTDERGTGALVAAIATALDVRPSDDGLSDIAQALRVERTVLVLDHVDHLAADAPVLNELLVACPPLTILAVSRTPLRLRDERVFHVEPFPADSTDAVALFHRAARTVGATIDDDPAIARVCAELDGLPLAIELAAARTRLLTPAELLDQLRRRSALAVLAGGGDDLPARQRGLHATIAWSHDLLDGIERRVLDAAATSHAWLTLDELIELACLATGLARAAVIDAIDGLDSHRLVVVQRANDTSVVRVRPLVREFVAGLDGHTPESADALHRTTVDFARRAIDGATTAARLHWLRAIDRRRDDLVAVLDRALTDGRVDDAGTLALAACLAWNRHPDPRRDERLTKVIDAQPAEPLLVRLLAWREFFRAQRAYEAAERSQVVEQFDALVRRGLDLEDMACVIDVCELSVSAAPYSLHIAAAGEHATIGRRCAVDCGDLRAVAVFDLAIAMVAHVHGELERAAELARSALRNARTSDDALTVALAEMLLGHLPRTVVEATGPVPSIRPATDQARRDDDVHLLATLLPTLAFELFAAGDLAGAARHAGEGLQVTSRLGRRGEADVMMLVLLLIAASSGDLHGAAVLHGVVHERLPLLRTTFPAVFSNALDVALESVRTRLGERNEQAAMSHGATLRLDEAISVALEVAARCDSPPAPTYGLTRKEVEVVRCLARGLTNKEIAAELGITNKTVMHHLTNVFRKLDVRNRSEAVAWAFSSGLVADLAASALAGS